MSFVAAFYKMEICCQFLRLRKHKQKDSLGWVSIQNKSTSLSLNLSQSYIINPLRPKYGKSSESDIPMVQDSIDQGSKSNSSLVDMSTK